MHPYIEFNTKPLNANNRDYSDPEFDDTASHVFHVFVKEKKLTISFIVEWRDPKQSPREFQVIKNDHLYLNGPDNGQYDPAMSSGVLSKDVSIDSAMFQETLDDYGIALDSLTVHHFEFFETTKFRFKDSTKKEQLYDLINEACKKTMHKDIM